MIDLKWINDLRSILSGLLLAFIASPVLAQEKLHTVCEMIIDGKGRSIVQEGKCDRRVSPASTFKIPLSLMGFDSGLLQSAHSPKMPVKKSYQIYLPEWGQPTDPQRWMRYSVVWYSQEIVAKLGSSKLSTYLDRFDYGNRDMRGHKGADPMKGFWIGSSLKISPKEQLQLMRRLMQADLNVSSGAMEKTREIMDLGVQANGWQLYGKTGSATPRNADGKRQSGEAFGWFIGFAQKGDRQIAFTKLVQSGRKEKKSLGLMAKDEIIRDYFGKSSPL